MEDPEKVELLATSTDPLLACCLCRRLLRDAVQLMCLHNCCRQCFSATVSNGGLVCGSCDTVTSAGSERPNSFIDGEAHRFSSIAESGACGVCKVYGEEDKAALVWCSACRHSLCADCVAGHRQFYRQHVTRSIDKLESLEEMYPQTSVSACPIHRKPLEIACLNCEKAMCISCCVECIESKHQMHVVGSESFDRYVSEFIASMSLMETQLVRMSEVLEKPRSILRDTRVERDRHLRQLAERKRRVVEAVELAYEEIELATKNAYDELESEYHSASAAIDRIASNLSDARNYVRRLVESNNKCEILNQQKIVRERLKVLSADVDDLSNSLRTGRRAVKVDASLPNDLVYVIREWIGIPHIYSVSPASVTFDAPSATHRLPVECCDIALTKTGRLLLAASEHGLIEMLSESGRELSRWLPPKRSSGQDDLVQAVAALSGGRAALCVFWAKRVMLLRRSETVGGDRSASAAGALAWIEERRLDQLPWPPRRLSAYGDIVAVVDDKHDEKLNKWTPGNRLQLVSLSSGRLLGGELQRPYDIRSVAVAAQAIVTVSFRKVQPSGSNGDRQQAAHVLDAHLLYAGGERLWRHELTYSAGDDEVMYGVFADSDGGCLYAAVLKSNLSSGRVSALSLADGSELRHVALSFDRSQQLLPVLLSLSEESSRARAEQWLDVTRGSSCRRRVLLAALCWDPVTKQQLTVTLHRCSGDK